MARTLPALLLCVLAALVRVASAEVYFEERFDAAWADRWLKSDWHVSDGTAGDFTRTAGKWYGDAEADAGVQTGPDARFYAMSADMGKTFTNENKPLVLQFSAKHEQKLDCGGGYIKLLPSTADVKSFGGDTPYAIMFGPDICGHATRRVHVILANKGDAKPANLLIKDDIRAETDQLTHVYTLIIYPNNSYVVKIDNVEVSTGAIEDRWDFLPPKTIKDPAASKPEDWDDRPVIPDPNDVKPDDWDELNPEYVDDVDAKKPDDWDDEEDGEWHAPTTKNPEYTGPWTQKNIANPDYQGQWEHPHIPNPDYDAAGADELYKFEDLRYVGFELWQVKAGTIFDNVLVTDDPMYAEKFANETWGAMRDAERKMFDAVEKARAEKEAEEARKVTDADLEADKRAQRADGPIAPPERDDDDDDDDDDDEYREEPVHDEL